MSETTGDKVYSGIAEFGRIRAGIGMVVAGFFAMIFLFVGVYLVFRKEKYTHYIVGRVVESVCRQTFNNNHKMFKCDMTIQYNVDGKEYIYKGTKQSSIEYNTNTDIDLYLNPDNHKDVSFSTTPRWLGWLMIGIGVVTGGLAGLQLYLTSRYKGYAAFTGAAGVAGAIGGGRRGGLSIVSPFL